MWVRDFRNFRVGLTERRLGHIFYRHPELRNKSALILEAVSEPDELYLDPGGGYHAVKTVEQAPADFLVVVYVTDDEGGMLFMRFSHDEIVQSEPTEDGLLLFHYSKAGDLTAIEIIDLAKMVRS